MTVTFRINLDESQFPQKKVFMCDLFPELDDAYFEGDYGIKFDPDTRQFYELQTVIDFAHEKNFSTFNFQALLKLIDHNIYIISKENDNFGEVKYENLQSFRRKVFIARNKVNQNNIKEGFVDGIMYYGGMTLEYIQFNLSLMLSIIDNAIKRQFDIIWN